MTRPGSINHFVRYMVRDTAVRIYTVFVGFTVCVFIPWMYLIDIGKLKENPYYVPSWKESAVWALIGLGAIGIALLGSTLVKYRKHLKIKV